MRAKVNVSVSVSVSVSVGVGVSVGVSMSASLRRTCPKLLMGDGAAGGPFGGGEAAAPPGGGEVYVAGGEAPMEAKLAEAASGGACDSKQGGARQEA